MKRIILCGLALSTTVSMAEMKKLTDEDKRLLKIPYLQLTAVQREQRDKAFELNFLIEEGGHMTMPGTPAGKIIVVNGQKRVPPSAFEKLHDTFSSLMEYDIRIVDDDNAHGDIVIRVIDAPGRQTLTVYPDSAEAVVNVAALSADSPKPAFLAARMRKEIARAFSCMTAGSTYPYPLFDKMPTLKSLDLVAGEEFPMDVMMRSTAYLKRAGVRPVEHTTYREVLECGWDIAPTNEYQQAIYTDVMSKKRLKK